jgi:hypothetical protein
MLDRMLGLLALASLIGFMLILMWFVPDIDLAIVIVVVALLAAYDFWVTLFKPKNGN